MYADLHMHSVFSDGTDTPEELCCLAEERGVSVISLTDHDAVDGVEQLMAFATPRGVRIIPGVEISCVWNYKQLHILCYYIDTRSEKLGKLISRMAADKTENTRVNFEYAVSVGAFSYPWERVVELSAGQPRITGIHVFNAMREDGYDGNGADFKRLFRDHFLPFGDRFINTGTVSGYEVIEIALAAGAVPVIAHPKSIGDDDRVASLLDRGAMGLEVFHPSHRAEHTEKYLDMAKRRGCLITGGSDWHGKNSSSYIAHFAVTGLEHAEYEILNMFPERIF